MEARIKREDLEYMLERTFGTNWKAKYHLHYDILGYKLYALNEDNTLVSISEYSRKLTTKEMYMYLNGLFDMKKLQIKQC